MCVDCPALLLVAVRYYLLIVSDDSQSAVKCLRFEADSRILLFRCEWRLTIDELAMRLGRIQRGCAH